jgi:Ni,Fe-hydrogenase III large subunit/Ni,Fe-hydrogenase III component G
MLQLTEFERIFGTEQKFVNGLTNELYLPIEPSKLQITIRGLSENGYELISLFCVQDFNGQEGFTLFYAFEKVGFLEIPVLQVHIEGAKADSIAKVYASACWYEREITDGFGIEFADAYDKRRLFLHETYFEGFHPLLKSFKNGPIQTKPFKVSDDEEYQFKKLEGEGVYQIPVGPVHAGIIEPGHFRFSVIGESILNLEVRMFYKHRGLEKLAEGKTPLDCVKIAETISGDETVANSVAYCRAVEKISGIAVPVGALQLRTVFLELERIYSHLGDMAGMVLDVAYPAGASSFFILREEILRFNEMLTGSRFMKDIITIGGLTKDVPEQTLKNLSTYLQGFCKHLKTAKDLDNTYFSLIDRFETTGIVKPELLVPLHITGPIARASGRMIDTRINHPYGIYGEMNLKGRTQPNGDVLSRFDLKAQEILDSVKMIIDLLTHLKQGEVFIESQTGDGYALSLIEAARGQSVHWVCIKNGVIDRYKIRTASFCNWQALEHAVLGNIVPDFPLINKSMNLSYAGTDL